MLLRLRLGVVGGLVALLAAACTGSDPATPGRPTPGADRTTSAGPTGADAETTSTLEWAITEPAGIAPATAVGETGLTVVDLLFDSLTRVDADGNVRPGLATGWTSSGGARIWTFHLDPQAVFHDGRPVTATDVVRGWESTVRAGRPQLYDVAGATALASGRATRLTGVRAVGARTLRVELRRPDTAFPTRVAHPALAPVPEEAGGAEFREQPVGNGPYRMAEPWAHGRFVRLARVDDARPSAGDAVREILFRIADPATSWIRFQQGRVDVAPVPGGALAEAQEQYGDALTSGDGAGVHTTGLPALVYLGFDLSIPPWDDPEVRRALSLAVDRPELVAAVGEGNGEAARAIAPPVVPGSERDTCGTCRRDVEEAAAVFADRGIGEVTLTIQRDGGDDVLVDRLRTDLAEAGVTLRVEALSFPELLEALEGGTVGLYRFGWFTELPDMVAAVAPLIGSGPTVTGVGANYGGYRNERVDALLDRARRTQVPALRAGLVVEAEEVALAEQALVPLYTTRARVAVGDEVVGFALDPFVGADVTGIRLRP